MLSTHDDSRLSEADQQMLLDVAENSIRIGLESGCVIEQELSSYSTSLRHIQSSFVTLRIDQQLRGCVGAIEASMPLVSDVNRHAHAAAFSDTRFPALCKDEFPQISIRISVLSPLKRLPTETLTDAMQHIEPGVHGVALRLGPRIATFLPEVWETFQSPDVFLRHLLLKAGLDPQSCCPETQVCTYTTQCLSREQPCRLQSSIGESVPDPSA